MKRCTSNTSYPWHLLLHLVAAALRADCRRASARHRAMGFLTKRRRSSADEGNLGSQGSGRALVASGAACGTVASQVAVVSGSAGDDVALGNALKVIKAFKVRLMARGRCFLEHSCATTDFKLSVCRRMRAAVPAAQLRSHPEARWLAWSALELAGPAGQQRLQPRRLRV